MRSAGDILRLFLDRNTAEQAELYHGFFSAWQEIVGERIAAHSRVKDVQNGIVHVEVDHPGWIQLIQLKQSQFVRTLKRRYPDLDIRGLRLQLPWKAPAKDTSGRTPKTPLQESPSRAEETAFPAEDAAEGAGGEERPADPLIRGALDRLGKAIERRAEEP